jgi:uncharacterized protein
LPPSTTVHQTSQRRPSAAGSSKARRLAGAAATLLGSALALLLWLVPVTAANALSLADLPAEPPASRVLDQADVLSRASKAELEKRLEGLEADHVDAHWVSVNRLDYGLSLQQLGTQLLERWSGDQPQLLLLVDSQTKTAAVLASPSLERQLPATLLRSTARTTMALPLREGDRYRQAGIDALERLQAVLDGGEDPGEPLVEVAPVAASNIPTREETASSNAFTWVVVLLVVGSVVPMATWWFFSR